MTKGACEVEITTGEWHTCLHQTGRQEVGQILFASLRFSMLETVSTDQSMSDPPYEYLALCIVPTLFDSYDKVCTHSPVPSQPPLDLISAGELSIGGASSNCGQITDHAASFGQCNTH